MATKLIDITRLGEYDVLLKGVITKREQKVSNLVGTVPAKVGEASVANLVDYVDKKIAQVSGDATTLEGRVAANETAIGKAKTDTTEATGLYAYVDNAAAAAITKIVAGASSSYDTLKEIEAWINNNTTGAAAMQNAIKFLQGTDGTVHTKSSASIPGVLLYIDDKVSKKNVDAGVNAGEALLTATPSGNKVTVASTQKLQDAVERAENAVLSVTKAATGNVEKYVSITVTDGDNATVKIDDTALNNKIGAAKTSSASATGMYADIQGNTNTTIAGLDTKVGALTAVGTESPATVIAYVNAKSAYDVKALQGNTTSTLKGVEDKIDDLEIATATDVSDLFK